MPLFNAAIGHASGHTLGLLTAGYPLGALLTFPLAAYFSDKFGRKKAIAVGAILTIAAALVQGLTKGMWALFSGRILIGIATSFEIVAAPTYVAEITHPRNRATSSALTQTCYYSKFPYHRIRLSPPLYISLTRFSRSHSRRLGYLWYFVH